MNVELVDINSVYPSAYNPRNTDPARLDLIELSLRKLGFVLPIYADENGEILSGHQRHLVAENMGLKKVPVCRIKKMTLEKRKALNIVFNRGTNDFQRNDDTHSISSELNFEKIFSLSEQFPDLNTDSLEFYPCLKIKTFPIDEVLVANKGKYNPYARNLARTLYNDGIIMPLLMKSNLTIINGIGRAYLLAEKKKKEVEGLIIEDAKAEFAELLLNKLSMDFNIHEKYSSVLRYNSFRRSVTNRPGIGHGFYAALFGDVRSGDIQLTGKTLFQWKQFYGTSVLDFGAGHLTDTKILQDAGIDVVPFEPYKIKSRTNQIDIEESRNLTIDFLEAVANGVNWDSIFISSVLNSVPFFEDRKHIITILAACSDKNTKVFGWTMSTGNKEWKSPEKDFLSDRAAKSLKFRLHYEEGIMIGGFNDKPKVQKYHSPEEAYNLFCTAFQEVKTRTMSGSISIIAEKPNFTKDELIKAIEFEFDLPYPDGSKLNLVNEAKRSFSKRLGVKL